MQADAVSRSHGPDKTVKQLLRQARSALSVSDASSALQCVVQALQLLRGDNAVIPTLQSAAEQYHAQRAAPIDEISALLSQVSLAAEQQQEGQQSQQAATGGHEHLHMQQQPQQEQHVVPRLTHDNPVWYQTQQQQPSQDTNNPQQLLLKMPNAPILEETGRGELASIALQQGSYWQCPHCSGVVPQQRQQAHLETWCPFLHRSNSDDMQQ